ncbi:MAG: hypothetical protein R2822_08985 [Spirosomataceae bacterium]
MTIAIGVEGGAAFDELTLTNKDDQMVRQTKMLGQMPFGQRGLYLL